MGCVGVVGFGTVEDMSFVRRVVVRVRRVVLSGMRSSSLVSLGVAGMVGAVAEVGSSFQVMSAPPDAMLESAAGDVPVDDVVALFDPPPSVPSRHGVSDEVLNAAVPAPSPERGGRVATCAAFDASLRVPLRMLSEQFFGDPVSQLGSLCVGQYRSFDVEGRSFGLTVGVLDTSAAGVCTEVSLTTRFVGGAVPLSFEDPVMVSACGDRPGAVLADFQSLTLEVDLDAAGVDPSVRVVDVSAVTCMFVFDDPSDRRCGPADVVLGDGALSFPHGH